MRTTAVGEVVVLRKPLVRAFRVATIAPARGEPQRWFLEWYDRGVFRRVEKPRRHDYHSYVEAVCVAHSLVDLHGIPRVADYEYPPSTFSGGGDAA